MIDSILSHNLVAIEKYFMELLLNINDHSVMHAEFNRGVLVIEKLLPFNCLHFNYFSAITLKIIGLNFMKLILNLFEHDVVMHLKFH